MHVIHTRIFQSNKKKRKKEKKLPSVVENVSPFTRLLFQSLQKSEAGKCLAKGDRELGQLPDK